MLSATVQGIELLGQNQVHTHVAHAVPQVKLAFSIKVIAGNGGAASGGRIAEQQRHCIDQRDGPLLVQLTPSPARRRRALALPPQQAPEAHLTGASRGRFNSVMQGSLPRSQRAIVYPVQEVCRHTAAT